MYEELKRTKMEHVGYKTHINVVSMKFSKISPKNCYLLVKERDNQIKSDDTLSMQSILIEIIDKLNRSIVPIR